MAGTANPSEAARLLAGGELVVLPTETVYGLGALADDPQAVAWLYAAKGRPADHPVIVHIPDADALEAWSREVPSYAHALAEHFWPGPLTLVLPRSSRARDDLTGGQSTVALRVSAHPTFREVLERVVEITGDRNSGIAAPSANRFGRVSPTRAEHVQREFDLLVVDGGPCDIGVESTIVDCTGSNPRILRFGAITAADIESVTGLPVGYDSALRAPGTLASHYAPTAAVHLIERDAPIADGDGNTGFVALADIQTPKGMVRLAEPRDPAEYAQVLYAALRGADEHGLPTVIAVLPPAEGIGIAVRDRLQRAAATTSEPS